MMLLAVLGLCAASVSASGQPWQTWLPMRQDSPTGGASNTGAAGKDLEVGVAIGVPNPGPGYSPEGVSLFGSPGWYAIPPQNINPIAASPAYDVSRKSAQQSVPTYQMWHPYLSSPMNLQIQPVQNLQPLQFQQPDTAVYQGPPLAVLQPPLAPQAWEDWAPAANPPPLPLLRAPGSVAGGALLAPTSNSQRRVGSFRLRSDRGYQLSMEVPPTINIPPGVSDGVLVMEMKATLYRPIG